MTHEAGHLVMCDSAHDVELHGGASGHWASYLEPAIASAEEGALVTSFMYANNYRLSGGIPTPESSTVSRIRGGSDSRQDSD